MRKGCAFKSCKNFIIGKNDPQGKGISFFTFPKPSKKNIEKCKRWVAAVNRPDLTIKNIKYHHFVCSAHFPGGKGPTLEYPDPVSEVFKNGILNNTTSKDGSTLTDREHRELKQEVPDVDEDQTSYKYEDQATKIEITKSADQLQLVSSLLSEPLSNLEHLRRSYFSYQFHASTPLLWSLEMTETLLKLCFSKLRSATSFIAVHILSSFEVKVLPYNKELEFIPEINLPLQPKIQSFSDLLNLFQKLDSLILCEGIDSSDLTSQFHTPSKSVHFCEDSQCLRSTKCTFLFESKRTKKCQNCRKAKDKLCIRLKRIKNRKQLAKGTNHRWMTKVEIQNKLKKRESDLLVARIQRLQNIENKLKSSIKEQKKYMHRNHRQAQFSLMASSSHDKEGLLLAEALKFLSPASTEKISNAAHVNSPPSCEAKVHVFPSSVKMEVL